MSIEPLGSKRPQMRQLGPYTIHSDPGHAWLEVPFEDVYLFGILFGKSLSNCSYMSADRKTLYLEEDSDWPKFMRAWKVMVLEASRQLGARLVKTEVHTNDYSFIRGLEPLHWQTCIDNYREEVSSE